VSYVQQLPATAFEARRLAQLEGLGFSLKPPKFVRKAVKAISKIQPGKVLAKVALPAAAIAAAALIPGAAPLALRAVTGVAKAAGGVLRAGGGAVKAAGGFVARSAPRILAPPKISTPPIIDSGRTTPQLEVPDLVRSGWQRLTQPSVEQRRRQFVRRPIDRVRDRQAAAPAPNVTAATPAPAPDMTTPATPAATLTTQPSPASDAAPTSPNSSGISPQLAIGAALVLGALVLGSKRR
jgi:hypothetical protein